MAIGLSFEEFLVCVFSSGSLSFAFLSFCILF